eukprot:CAMPEP_0113698234 /NCGR_PEP_ID=MMETSP0038_2-20120614/22592_1 /TAXON_ID=2898 /ORGANISM="Cryptomonas paramecium" /LENGTH=35 /DNA_ID=CAMNT_0000621365 /DNA_START=237 /DNA_END=340 /DNA_ORIENTATION=- /assembly_acc=CAM_ASM_000170
MESEDLNLTCMYSIVTTLPYSRGGRPALAKMLPGL